MNRRPFLMKNRLGLFGDFQTQKPLPKRIIGKTGEETNSDIYN
jgi:hypothetical protein